MVELISIAVLWSLCPSKIHVPSQILKLPKIKNTFKLKWMRLLRNFFITNICFLIWSIKWRCKQINKKKTFFVTKISFERCLCVGNVSITHRGSFVLLSFYGESLVISAFQVILHVSVLWFILKIFQPHKD